MVCSLCYTTNENLIEFDGEEAKLINLDSIVYKYFAFCFEVSFKILIW